MELDPRITTHYEQEYPEVERFTKSDVGRWVLLRTWDIFERFLRPAPARLLDVGGGPGVHAEHLAAQGYDVALVDPVEVHVEQAHERGGFTAQVGDARGLEFDDESADIVLLLGPLYHLLDRSHRDKALSEALRVLRPGGQLVAETITRHAWLIDACIKGLLDQAHEREPGGPTLWDSFERTIDEGHTQPPGRQGFVAYLHRPDEHRAEVVEAGFAVDALLSVESFGWMLGDLDHHLADPANLLRAARLAEAEPTMLGSGAHIISVSTKR
jgi:SAM-dependent methyltransferase